MVLVDEHQDTSELQEAIIELVTRDAPAQQDGGRPRFVVGDLKQSIYGFRLATPRQFSARTPAPAGTAGRRAGLRRVIRLLSNFRSRQSVVRGINHLFDGLMTERLGGEDYGANQLSYGAGYEKLAAPAGLDSAAAADSPLRLHLLLDAEQQEQPGEDDGQSEENGEQVSPNLLATRYGYVARLIAEIQRGGQLVYDKHADDGRGSLRPVAWRDITVLLRTLHGRVETLLRELGLAGRPGACPGPQRFLRTPEVADALALLRVIDNPLGDAALAAVLRGPAVRLEPVELLEVARAGEFRWPCGTGCRPVLLFPERGRGAARAADRLRRPAGKVARTPRRCCRQPSCCGGFFTRAACWLRPPAPIPPIRAWASSAWPTCFCCTTWRGSFSGAARQGLYRFLRFVELNRRAAGDLGEARCCARRRTSYR